MDVSKNGQQTTQTDVTRARNAANSKLFRRVVEVYAACLEHVPLVARNYDKFAPSKKLTPIVVEFLSDIENATKAALSGTGLYASWLALVMGQPVEVATAARITKQCGRIYAVRHLDPRRYFKPIHNQKPVHGGRRAA